MLSPSALMHRPEVLLEEGHPLPYQPESLAETSWLDKDLESRDE